MRHAFDTDGNDGRRFKSSEHDPSQGIADSMTKASFKWLYDKFCKIRILCRLIILILSGISNLPYLTAIIQSPISLEYYTRLLLRARHPLCGWRLSRMMVRESPELRRPRTADSLPAPGPFKFTSHSFIPIPIANLCCILRSYCAANADDFREPEKIHFSC